ncbi:MAG: PPOX class F420-dependent oxidoreductase [Acidimicrobiia bacterium]|nr:PPOX class F420-dependent oxidoreductase [Acidimicrobiia bacterium]
MAQKLTPAESLDWVFARPRTAKLATVTASGAPHVAPVWVARDSDDLVFTTGADTLKGRGLLRDPRVSLCFDDEEPPFSFVVVSGAARLSEDPDELLRWATAVAGRYMGDDVAEAFGRRNAVPGELLVTVTPTKVTGALDVTG